MKFRVTGSVPLSLYDLGYYDWDHGMEAEEFIDYEGGGDDRPIDMVVEAMDQRSALEATCLRQEYWAGLTVTEMAENGD